MFRAERVRQGCCKSHPALTHCSLTILFASPSMTSQSTSSPCTTSSRSYSFFSAFELWFFGLVIFLSLVSLASIAFLSSSCFTPVNVAGAAVVSLSVSIALFRRLRPKARPQGVSRYEWGAVAIVVVALLLRCNVGIVVYGGQDPGVYTNIASEFSQHGSVVIKDRLLDEFEGRPDLREYYVAKSLRGVSRDPDGNWIGNMVPGVYLEDLDSNKWVAQFYHVNTVWLAIGQWIFGGEWGGLTLAFLSSLTCLAAYLIASRISQSRAAGLAAAALLATNAAHSYIATSPVSEAVAGFFFLSALSMLTARWYMLSVVPFTALFLTRITGFVTAPIVMLSLAWIVVKRRDVRAAWSGIALLSAYALSVLWGLSFSGPYARSIYRGKLGIPSWLLEYAPYAFVGVGLGWGLFCLVALRYRRHVRMLCRWIVRYRTQLTVAIICSVLAVVSCRGYLLGFTDYYSTNRWLAVRWDIAAHGVKSLRYLTVYSLLLMLSPIGLAVFVIGLGYVGRLAFGRAVVAPLAMCSIGFFAALTCKQLTTPYLYYFGRYLVSELVPLAIVCGVLAVSALAKRAPRWKTMILTAYCGIVFVLLFPSFQARLKIREGQQFFEAMSCIDQATPGRAVILIDKKDFPEIPVVTALRFAFQKATFSLIEQEYGNAERLDDLIAHLKSRGFNVYLLSSRDLWQARAGFTKVFRISAVMRTLGGKGQAPTKINTLGLPLRLYSLGELAVLPDICRKVKEYS